MALIYMSVSFCGTYFPLHDTEWLPLDPSVVFDPLFILDVVPNDFNFLGIFHLSISGSILFRSLLVRQGLGFE